MTRVIVYTGKGGVGKTSIAAATALLCAKRKMRTLIVSTDIAHSLGDAFDQAIGPEPAKVKLREDLPLEAQETDVFFTIRRYWGTIQSYFADVFQWRGLDQVIAEEMTILPGLDELVGLLQIVDYHDSGKYDVIVVDAAPTGETIRLLALPEAARWWVDRMLPIQRRVTQLAGPMIRRVTGMPMPDEAVFRAGEDLFRTLDRMQRLLNDPDVSSLRIVLNLEKMVIKEAQRSFTYFSLFGYPTDLVVCNRVLPADSGAFLAGWREKQLRYLEEVEPAFDPVPVRQVPLLAHEVLGEDDLTQLGKALFGSDDPASIFSRRRPYRIDAEGDGYTLSIELPFAEKGDIKMQRSREELLLQVGRWRRSIILPHALAELATGEAKLTDDHQLRIRFAGVSRSRWEEDDDGGLQARRDRGVGRDARASGAPRRGPSRTTR